MGSSSRAHTAIPTARARAQAAIMIVVITRGIKSRSFSCGAGNFPQFECHHPYMEIFTHSVVYEAVWPHISDKIG